MSAIPADADQSLALYECENLLAAWGAFLRREVAAEVGYPTVSPSCADYESPPEWAPPPPSPVQQGDVDRACWAMIVMLSRHKRLHRDLIEHYRDGRRLGYERKREGWIHFRLIWSEWDGMTGPANAI